MVPLFKIPTVNPLYRLVGVIETTATAELAKGPYLLSVGLIAAISRLSFNNIAILVP